MVQLQWWHGLVPFVLWLLFYAHFQQQFFVLTRNRGLMLSADVLQLHQTWEIELHVWYTGFAECLTNNSWLGSGLASYATTNVVIWSRVLWCNSSAIVSQALCAKNPERYIQWHKILFKEIICHWIDSLKHWVSNETNWNVAFLVTAAWWILSKFISKNGKMAHFFRAQCTHTHTMSHSLLDITSSDSVQLV